MALSCSLARKCAKAMAYCNAGKCRCWHLRGVASLAAFIAIHREPGNCSMSLGERRRRNSQALSANIVSATTTASTITMMRTIVPKFSRLPWKGYSSVPLCRKASDRRSPARFYGFPPSAYPPQAQGEAFKFRDASFQLFGSFFHVAPLRQFTHKFTLANVEGAMRRMSAIQWMCSAKER